MHKNETKGEIFLLIYIALFGLFPVVTNYTTKIMPPVLFAAGSTLFASATLFFWLLFTRQLRLIFHKKAFLNILGITFFNIIIPFTLIFIGTSKTSAINTSLLIQLELIYTFILCALFFGETITRQKVTGGLLMTLGVLFVLYRGNFQWNFGDLLIIIATVFYPFGNNFSKKALKLTTPAVIVFLRNLMGGLVLLTISLTFETDASSLPSLFFANWKMFVLNGVFLLAGAKLFWFFGLRYTDISKAIAITRAEVIFSMLYAFLFLREIPTLNQLIGFFVILAGLFVLTRKKPPEVVEMS